MTYLIPTFPGRGAVRGEVGFLEGLLTSNTPPLPQTPSCQSGNTRSGGTSR
jgi:hypothetical protein